jgi:molybdopterin synthase catalytic subunit
MSPVTVSVRLFAILREQAGTDSIEIELDDGATVADALTELAGSSGLTELLDRMPVQMAVNRTYASPQTQLQPGDELALIPPVSGGAEVPDRPSGGADVHVRVTGEPLSLESLARSVSRPGAGAVVTFQGMTREVSRLDYEAYREMAEERIEAIVRECVERHGLEAAAAEHRIGTVPLGEASVIVAVSAAHRAEAFAGAREAIDRIKAEAPIWKREVEQDGASRWVAGKQPPLDRGPQEQAQ